MGQTMRAKRPVKARDSFAKARAGTSFAGPRPMIPRELRAEYMAAVSGATGTPRDYAPLALLHAQAVRRSLSCQLALARLQLEAEALPTAADADAAIAEAFLRGDCALRLAVDAVA